MTDSEPTSQKLNDFSNLIARNLKVDELRELIHPFEVKYEELHGDTKAEKMLHFVMELYHTEEMSMLEGLIDWLKKYHSNHDWPSHNSLLNDPTVSVKEQPPASAKYTHEQTGLEMIHIPAGKFLYGDDSNDNAAKQEIVKLKEYWISKTPVTNKHYKKFKKTHSYPEDKANHPVVLVSWHNAQAFAKWAGMELPTEQEWEKAASWDSDQNEKLRYPWGNDWDKENCNTEESGIRSTTPVNQYAGKGDSPYGCLDMVGNVWNWTSSWLDNSKTRQLVRGGSWGLDQYSALAAHRNHDTPNYRNLFIGFRVVSRQSPSS